MLAELKPYPEYVAANIPGVHAVPAHWRAARIKTALRELDRRSSDGSGTLLSLTRVRGLIRQSEMTSKATTAETLEGYKLYRPGEIVMNRMQAWSGMFGTCPEAGLVSPDYAVFRVLDGNDSAFLVHLLRSPAMVAQFAVESKGIGSGFNRLYTDKFGAISVPLPPLAEQAGIVRFLGAVDRKVNRFIRAKRRLIEVLTEQKQAIITHAVTKGLNPHAPLKPSGIDWLGDVPAHWDVQRLKWLAHIKTGGRDTVHRKDDGAYPFFVRSQTVERIDTYCFDGEAVLTAGDGAGVAKVFHYVNGKFDYHQRVYKFSDFRRVRGKFFFHYFSVTLRFEAFRETAKSTVDSLRLPMLQDFPVPIPPLEEQDAIVAYVEEQTSGINKSISLIRREIDLIREYRTRLIADVVTGKLDVRGFVPTEPMPADEPADEPIEEVGLEDEEAELVEEAVDAAD